MENCILLSSQSYFPDDNENILESIFKQYEYVIIQSLVTSFGLDFLVKDRLGGDVDTIHNARQGIYQKQVNQDAYADRGEYDSTAYHSDHRYKTKNRVISEQRKNGELVDAYTGERIARNGRSDLDHVVSAKEIHEDAGRVLAGLSGVDLANSDENLQATNPHTNRTKKAMSMDDFLERYGDEYTPEQKANMQNRDAIARKSYEAKVAKAYYTSPSFAKDLATASGKVGVQMGLRQAIGFVFAEIWFSVKEEFERLNVQPGLDMDMGDFFRSIGSGVKRGFESAKSKYKDLFAQFATGETAGVLSSVTTTICNIFFTTAKNIVKIIRQSYASIVEAGKILFINPQNYPLGERLRAVVKVLATGASVVLGGIVSEAISKTPIGAIPVIGDIVQTFCGTLCTGIVSCTLLYYLDSSAVMNKLVCWLNSIHTIEDDIAFYKNQAVLFERYAAELMKIDIESFKKETAQYAQVVESISATSTPEELNVVLKKTLDSLGVRVSWGESHDSFDSFMRDKNARMVFS